MGCDIHMHTEIKVDGKWEHYGAPKVDRCYALFALIADVRNSDGKIKPISKPKGLPADANWLTRKSSDEFGVDGHSHSYLTSAEIARLEDAWNKLNTGETKWRERCDLEHHLIGYCEGHTWSSWFKYKSEMPAWIEDVRWVFWFDN